MVDIAALSESAKILLTDGLGWGRDGAHVHVGMIVFIGGYLLSGRRSPGLALLALLVLELANELIDLNFFAGASQARQLGSMRDVVTTMLGPTLLWIILARSATVSRRAEVPVAGPSALQPGQY